MKTLFEIAVLFVALRIVWYFYKNALGGLVESKILEKKIKIYLFFQENEISFEDPAFKAICGMIDKYASCASTFRLSSSIYFSKNASRELIDYLEQINDLKFISNRNNIIKFYAEIEKSIFRWIDFYMFTTTVWFCPFFYLLLMCCFFHLRIFKPLEETGKCAINHFTRFINSVIPDNSAIPSNSAIRLTAMMQTA